MDTLETMLCTVGREVSGPLPSPRTPEPKPYTLTRGGCLVGVPWEGPRSVLSLKYVQRTPELVLLL